VASIGSLKSSDDNKIPPGSFVTFETSIVVIGLAGRLMYDSGLSTSSIMLILLARAMRSSIF
jgi:hypothetical protein